MSIKLMAQVWEKQTTAGQQRVLLALCDHANDRGTNCYPSLALLGWKIGLSERQIMRVISELEEIGAIQVRRSHRRVNSYRIMLGNLPEKAPFKGTYEDDEEWPDDEILHDNMSPNEESLHEKMSPKSDTDVTLTDPKCHPNVPEMSPKPPTNQSINHQIEPSPSSDDDEQSLTDLKNHFAKTNSRTKTKKGKPRRDDRRVWSLVSAYYGALDVPERSVPDGQRISVYEVFTGLPGLYGTEQIARMVQFLQSDDWYRVPGRLTAKAVVEKIAQWRAAGEPQSVADMGVKGKRQHNADAAMDMLSMVQEMRDQGR